MRIEDIVRAKGAGVVTIGPSASVEDLVALLGEHRIGAVVVSSDGVHIDWHRERAGRRPFTG